MSKKVYNSILASAFISISFFIGTHSASAQAFPVIDVVAVAALGGIAGSTSTGAAANQTQTWTKVAQDAAEAALYSASQTISRKLVAMTLNAANGGASGFDQPQQFVDDFANLANDIVKRETKVFSDKMLSSGGDSDTIYGKAIAVGLVNAAASNGMGYLNSSIDKIPGVDYHSATYDLRTAGDKGLTFYSQSAMPSNTPFGSALQAQQRLAENIKFAREVNSKELSTSGYKPTKKPCDVTHSSTSQALIDAQTQLVAAQAAYDAAVADGGGVPTQQQQQVIDDNQHDLEVAQQNLATVQSQQNAANTEFGLGCANSVITNPRGTVESLVQQATLAPFQKLDQNDKWFKLLINTTTQLVTGLVRVGISKIPTNPFLSSPGVSHYDPSNIPAPPIP